MANFNIKHYLGNAYLSEKKKKKRMLLKVMDTTRKVLMQNL